MIPYQALAALTATGHTYRVCTANQPSARQASFDRLRRLLRTPARAGMPGRAGGKATDQTGGFAADQGSPEGTAWRGHPRKPQFMNYLHTKTGALKKAPKNEEDLR